MTTYTTLTAKNVGESLSSLKNPNRRDTQQTDYYGVMYRTGGLYQSIDQILGSPRLLSSTETKLGDIVYLDLNGDGKLDSEDQRRTGMPTSPHFTYAVDFSLGYKGFTLSGLFYGTGKRSMMMGINNRKATAQYILNTYQLDYWREDNRNAAFPRISNTGERNGSNNTMSSEFYLKNAAFLRLKNLSLDYDFKYSLLKNASWLTTCRVNLTAANLFTISGITKYFDPETTNTNGGYPVSRIYSLGLTLGF